MPSSILAARVALHGRLAISPGLAGVEVTYGPPDTYEDQEVVALLGISDPSEEFAAIGQLRKEEAYTIDLVVKAHDPAGTAQSVDARAYAMAEVVRTEVYADITLGGVARTARIAGLRSDGPLRALDPQTQEGAGWVCYVAIPVEIVQRIT